MFMISDARRDRLLTEQVMTQTFLGFCLSQLCMFLHTAKRLWRLGACREGQLHSDTWRRRTRRERWPGRDAEEKGGQTLATVARMSHLTKTRQLVGGHFVRDESTPPLARWWQSPRQGCAGVSSARHGRLCVFPQVIQTRLHRHCDCCWNARCNFPIFG